MNTHDSLLVKKNSLDTLFYKLVTDKLFLNFAFPYQRSLLKVNSLNLADIHHTQKYVINHSINHEYHLFKVTSNSLQILPQTFIGASISNRIGYCKNTSLALMQSPRISLSVKFTYLPGLEPRTSSSLVIILSISISTLLFNIFRISYLIIFITIIIICNKSIFCIAFYFCVKLPKKPIEK